MKDEQRRKQREKEKERLERKKKEGTLLTPQQKGGYSDYNYDMSYVMRYGIRSIKEYR